MCNLRIEILTKEAEEIKISNKALDKKVKENKEVVSHLKGREEEVTRQIQKLEGEIDLIQSHTRESEQQNEQYRVQKQEGVQKIDYIISSIEQIYQEKEKYKVLSRIRN